MFLGEKESVLPGMAICFVKKSGNGEASPSRLECFWFVMGGHCCIDSNVASNMQVLCGFPECFVFLVSKFGAVCWVFVAGWVYIQPFLRKYRTMISAIVIITPQNIG